MVDLQLAQLDDDCTVGSIATLILQDVGLSGRILKTINSPYFGFDNKITSIQQAITLLGIPTVVNIVNSLSIRSSLSDDNIVKMTRFWDSAMDNASVCAAISRQIGLASPDEAYMIGLFHNCGNILMMHRFDNFCEVVESSYAREDRRVVDTENELLHTNHSVVGYYISKAWHLPPHISTAISQHHSAEDIFDDHEYKDPTAKNLMAILKMSEHACANYQVLGNQKEDHEWNRIEDSVLDYVGLSHDDYLHLTENLQDLGLIAA
jgi:HD-like signal output (HDOD) protein